MHPSAPLHEIREIHRHHPNTSNQCLRALIDSDRYSLRRNLPGDLIDSFPRQASVWLRVPDHWQADHLVRALRKRDIAVTSPEPFLVRTVEPRPNAVRLCVGAECSDEVFLQALRTVREVFEQFPQVHAFD